MRGDRKLRRIEDRIAYRIKRNKNRHRKRYSSELYHSDINRGLLYNARARAKKAKLPFSITKDDIIIPAICPILDIPIILGSHKTVPGSPSLDRIVPELGYVKGNIAVISHKANRLKSNMTKDIIKRLYDYVSKS